MCIEWNTIRSPIFSNGVYSTQTNGGSCEQATIDGMYLLIFTKLHTKKSVT